MYLIKPIYILQIKLVLESFGLGLDDFQLKDDVKEFISCVKSGFLLEFFNVVIIKYNISVVLDTITLASLTKGKIAAHYVPNIFLQTFCYSIYVCLYTLFAYYPLFTSRVSNHKAQGLYPDDCVKKNNFQDHPLSIYLLLPYHFWMCMNNFHL